MQDGSDKIPTTATLYLPKTLEGYYVDGETEPHTSFVYETADGVDMTVAMVRKELEARTFIPAKYWSLIDSDSVIKNNNKIDF